MYIFPYKTKKKQIWPCRKNGQGHHLNKLCWAQVPEAAYQAPRSLTLWFQRRRFLKGLYHIWALWPSWLWTNFRSPDPWRLHIIWLRLAQRFLRRRCSKSVYDGRRRTDDGTCLYYKLTYEPSLKAQVSQKKNNVGVYRNDVLISCMISSLPKNPLSKFIYYHHKY